MYTHMPLWMKFFIPVGWPLSAVCAQGGVCLQMHTGVCGCRFMPLYRHVDTPALVYFCVYMKTYTLLSIRSINNVTIQDLTIANDIKSNWKLFKHKGNLLAHFTELSKVSFKSPLGKGRSREPHLVVTNSQHSAAEQECPGFPDQEFLLLVSWSGSLRWALPKALSIFWVVVSLLLGNSWGK